MREISIQKNEAGQRMDKFLAKYLNKAPKSFRRKKRPLQENRQRERRYS